MYNFVWCALAAGCLVLFKFVTSFRLRFGYVFLLCFCLEFDLCYLRSIVDDCLLGFCFGDLVGYSLVEFGLVVFDFGGICAWFIDYV